MPTDPSAPLDRTGLTGRHVRRVAGYVDDAGHVGETEGTCAWCDVPWPCDVAQLLAALQAAEVAREEAYARRDYWCAEAGRVATELACLRTVLAALAVGR